MCPFCFATLGLVVAGTVSTGGLAALAVRVSRKKNHAAQGSNENGRSSEDSHPHNR
jgi:hypothetical protein